MKTGAKDFGGCHISRLNHDISAYYQSYENNNRYTIYCYHCVLIIILLLLQQRRLYLKF